MAALDLGPGEPQPPRGVLGRGAAGRQLLALLPARRAGAAPPLRRGRPGPPRRRPRHRPAAEQDLGPVALPAGRGRPARRPLLRLLGRRPALRPGPPRVRPGQGPPRPRRQGGLLPAVVRPRGGPASGPQRRDGPPGRPAPPGAGVRLGGRPAPTPRLGHGHLRDARARLHAEPDERGLARGAGHLRRRGREGALPPVPGRHDRRAAPGAAVRPPGGELLGLHAAELLRPPPVLRRRPDRPAPRVQGHGQGPARGGDRGHPRRRLQPHGRGGPHGADLQLPGDRRRDLLPRLGRPRPPVPGLLRLRQHARLPRVGRPRPHPRQPAVLGHRDARRRLPVRPGLGARPQPRRVLRRPRRPAADRDPGRPGPARGPPDRRAVGRGRRLPARDAVPRPPLAAVERPLPRRRPPLRPGGPVHGAGA